MTLPEPAVLPPMVLLEAPAEMKTPPPKPELPRAAVPVGLVPMKFPRTELLIAPDPPIQTPSPVFPEMTFAAPATVPPITILRASVSFVWLIRSPSPTKTPNPELGNAANPILSTPIKLPETVPLVVPLPMKATPPELFPEITLPAPAAVPPIDTPGEWRTRMPKKAFPASTRPVESTPT